MFPFSMSTFTTQSLEFTLGTSEESVGSKTGISSDENRCDRNKPELRKEQHFPLKVMSNKELQRLLRFPQRTLNCLCIYLITPFCEAKE